MLSSSEVPLLLIIIAIKADATASDSDQKGRGRKKASTALLGRELETGNFDGGVGGGREHTCPKVDP